MKKILKDVARDYPVLAIITFVMAGCMLMEYFVDNDPASAVEFFWIWLVSMFIYFPGSVVLVEIGKFIDRINETHRIVKELEIDMHERRAKQVEFDSQSKEPQP